LEEVRYGEPKASALAIERGIVRERIAEKPGAAPEAVSGINVRCGQLAFPNQSPIVYVVGCVEGIPKGVAVEPRVVILKIQSPLPAGIVADLRVGPRLQELRCEPDVLLIRAEVRRPERRDRCVDVKVRRFGLLGRSRFSERSDDGE